MLTHRPMSGTWTGEDKENSCKITIRLKLLRRLITRTRRPSLKRVIMVTPLQSLTITSSL